MPGQVLMLLRRNAGLANPCDERVPQGVEIGVPALRVAIGQKVALFAPRSFLGVQCLGKPMFAGGLQVLLDHHERTRFPLARPNGFAGRFVPQEILKDAGNVGWQRLHGFPTVLGAGRFHRGRRRGGVQVERFRRHAGQLRSAQARGAGRQVEKMAINASKQADASGAGARRVEPSAQLFRVEVAFSVRFPDLGSVTV